MTLLIDAFILLYLVVAWSWRLPRQTAGWTIIIEPAAWWLRWAGLEQGWSMFTPDPPQADHHLQVIVRLRSGRAIVWEPPHMHAGSRWNAFVKFRYREYASAIVSDASSACRPALVDYVLRKYDTRGDPAVEVLLVCRRHPIAAPGSAQPPEPSDLLVVHRQTVSTPS